MKIIDVTKYIIKIITISVTFVRYSSYNYQMYKLLTILIFLISSISYSQDTTDVVYDFIVSSINKKVGNGDCREFVIEAENKKYNDWANDYLFNGFDCMMEHWIEIDSVMASDIIIFKDVIFSDSSTISQHIGFVSYKENNLLTYLSQNVGDQDDEEAEIIFHGNKTKVFKDSRVVWTTINLDEIISGHIYTFRF